MLERPLVERIYIIHVFVLFHNNLYEVVLVHSLPFFLQLFNLLVLLTVEILTVVKTVIASKVAQVRID